jgi:hypothetical protein
MKLWRILEFSRRKRKPFHFRLESNISFSKKILMMQKDLSLIGACLIDYFGANGRGIAAKRFSYISMQAAGNMN